MVTIDMKGTGNKIRDMRKKIWYDNQTNSGCLWNICGSSLQVAKRTSSSLYR